MALTTTITSVIKLPLSIAGRLLGAVTGRSSSTDAPTPPPPTDVAAAPSAPVAREPVATATDVVEPMPSSGTAIDAAADAEDVDVTPADLAKVMGTQLGGDSPTAP